MTIRLLFVALIITILGAAPPPKDTRSLAERLYDDPTTESEPDKPTWQELRRARLQDIAKRSNATQARIKAELASRQRAQSSAARLRRSMSGSYRICPGGVCR